MLAVLFFFPKQLKIMLLMMNYAKHYANTIYRKPIFTPAPWKTLTNKQTN